MIWVLELDSNGFFAMQISFVELGSPTEFHVQSHVALPTRNYGLVKLTCRLSATNRRWYVLLSSKSDVIVFF